MDISYKIRVFNKTTGSIVVEFQDFPPFNIDLPLNDGKYPEGDELDQYIRGFLPIEYIQRVQIIAQGVENESSIESLVEPWPEITTELPRTATSSDVVAVIDPINKEVS